MSSSSFWCHFCHSIVRISSSSPSLFCPTCGFGFVEEISNEPGFLLISGTPRATDPASNVDGNLRDVAASRSPASGLGFLRRLFRSNRSSRQASEGRPSLLQVLEIASSLQRSRDGERSNEGGDTGSHTPLGFSFMNGDNNDLSRILGVRGEDRSSVSGIPSAEGSNSIVERPSDDTHAPRPIELLLHRLLSGILQSGRSGSLPASKAAIAAMPTFKISKRSLESEACGDLETLHECAVCKEVFEIGGEVKEMPCKHFYHSNCILPWLELHSSCPLCRQEMPVDEDERPSSSATSDPTAGPTGGEPTIVFIGISGTGVLVFSFIMLGAGSRNETINSGNLQGEQGNQVLGAVGNLGSGSSESTPGTLTGNARSGVESDERDSFEAGQILSSPSNDTEQVPDQSGSLGKRNETSEVSVGQNDSNLHEEECSNGNLRDVTREISTAQEGPGPSSTSLGLENWGERRLHQFISEGEADTSSGSRGRSFFSWFFRHAAARNTPPSTAEGSAESTSDCLTARPDDLDENAA
ncbi:hypothetical protein GOP47_0008904 [Adiantum capillus-veneris]|uniref:RING-type E3 ubiquitin transferase n=1 Tax=Adiantum capillus-veneris TaxID=13818 RepID=A0A9D4ZIL2_ADICA|nr:hypothetical protein GOP47_0008904 [Adiantum capillus-veneris]